MGFYDDIADAEPKDAKGWKPSPGDSLVGTVQYYDTGDSDYQERVPICVIEAEDRDGRATGDLVAIWVFHEVLRQHFQRLKPQPGERIGVKYHGKHPEKRYKLYTLKVDRDGPPPTDVPDFDSYFGGDVAPSDREEAREAARDAERRDTSPEPEDAFGDRGGDDLPF